MLLVEILNEGDVVDLAQRRAIKKRKNLEPSESEWISDFVTGSLLGSGASPDLATKLTPILSKWISREIDYALKHSPYARTRTEFIKPRNSGIPEAGHRLSGMMKDLIFFILHNDLKNLFNIDERTLEAIVKKTREKMERKSRLKLVKPNAMVDLDGPETLTPEIDDRRDAGRERDGYSLPLPP